MISMVVCLKKDSLGKFLDHGVFSILPRMLKYPSTWIFQGLESTILGNKYKWFEWYGLFVM